MDMVAGLSVIGQGKVAGLTPVGAPVPDARAGVDFLDLLLGADDTPDAPAGAVAPAKDSAQDEPPALVPAMFFDPSALSLLPPLPVRLMKLPDQGTAASSADQLAAEGQHPPVPKGAAQEEGGSAAFGGTPLPVRLSQPEQVYEVPNAGQEPPAGLAGSLRPEQVPVGAEMLQDDPPAGAPSMAAADMPALPTRGGDERPGPHDLRNQPSQISPPERRAAEVHPRVDPTGDTAMPAHEQAETVVRRQEAALGKNIQPEAALSVGVPDRQGAERALPQGTGPAVSAQALPPPAGAHEAPAAPQQRRRGDRVRIAAGLPPPMPAGLSVGEKLLPANVSVASEGATSPVGTLRPEAPQAAPPGPPAWSQGLVQGLDQPRPNAPAFAGHMTAHPGHEAPPVSRQLAQHLPAMGGGPVEITLSPEELGRVRMTLASGEGGLVLQLVADRADTLDLMRRHIDQLAQDFRAMGFERLSFAFGQGQQGQQGTGQPMVQPVFEHEAAAGPALPDKSPASHRPPRPAPLPDDRLDLRF